MKYIYKTLSFVAAIAVGAFALVSCTDEENHTYGVDDLTGVLTFYDLQDVRNRTTNEEISTYMQDMDYSGVQYNFSKTEKFSLLSLTDALPVSYEFYAIAQTNAQLVIKWLNLSTIKALLERRLPEIAPVMDGYTFRYAYLNGNTYSSAESAIAAFTQIDFAAYTYTQFALDIYYESACVTVSVQNHDANGYYHLKYQINHL